MDLMSRVLLLSNKNSARSQMAEAFLNRYGGGRLEAHSAGLEPGEIDPLTIRVMAELGYDLAVHRAKGVREYLGKVFFRYLIIPCGKTEENCPRVWPGVSERVFWPLNDPTTYEGPEEEKLSRFREIRDQIEALAMAWVAEKVTPRVPEQSRPALVPAFIAMPTPALAPTPTTVGARALMFADDRHG